MFKDMELAREEVATYKSTLEERNSRPSVDLNVSVLSASAWPSYPDVPLIIPREVQQQANVFEQHYKVKHTGRKLYWKHSLAHCQLKASLPKGDKELVVSSYQAVVLLIFKDKSASEEIPYEHIQAASGLGKQFDALLVDAHANAHPRQIISNLSVPCNLLHAPNIGC